MTTTAPTSIGALGEQIATKLRRRFQLILAVLGKKLDEGCEPDLIEPGRYFLIERNRYTGDLWVVTHDDERQVADYGNETDRDYWDPEVVVDLATGSRHTVVTRYVLGPSPERSR